MTGTEDVIPGLEQKLDMTNALLQSYANDLRLVVASEREKATALAAAHARLQLLDRLKLDFLVFIAHELKTPLTAIAAVDMLEDDSSAEDRRELVAIAKGGHARLQSLVERGLEYFAWMARPIVDAPTTVEVVRLLQESVQDNRIEVSIDPSAADSMVRGNVAALRRVVAVLLDNALQFSGDQVLVTLGLVENRVRIAVVDRGVGFPPDLREEIFSPFTIPDTAHHSKGSGLSLALARAMMTAHGGTLTASSSGPGHGATFTLELPTEAVIATGVGP